MARPTKTFPLLTVTLIFLLFITVAGGERGKGVEGWLPLGWNPSLSGCRGTIAECLAGYNPTLGSEASRHVLANSIYIA
ncbi:unnamed protein product [Musa acuminata subsp. malaccensis]|uniref:(wild Malaysian banana) hypothetical protein n=1 Tax=Musa acuminata subsp. malaccensis TaxID=214687 RepID=A0A8D7BAI3_MUSAM|nr:unnamed protein product [Musa acuminata subsp. malaccensis]